jgi:hypothetical protein
MMGVFSAGQLQCLEERYAAEVKQTSKGKVSRILMANAWGAEKVGEWEKLVLRHLNEVDQSDPELCFKYARTLSKKGVSRANEVIRWADVADQNRTYWTGDRYTSRVYGLHKMRTAAAQSLWQAAEGAHTSAPTSDTKANVESARTRTKVASREWYEYAKVAGKDVTLALAVCESAAGTAGYCEAE